MDLVPGTWTSSSMIVFIVSFTAILVCGRLYKVLPCDYLVSRSRLATCWHTNGTTTWDHLENGHCTM